MPIPPASELSGSTRLELQRVIESFEQAWFRGSNPIIEDYLTANPLLRTALLTELVQIDMELRGKRGEIVDFNAYLTRFPELSDESDAVASIRNASENFNKMITKPLDPNGLHSKSNQFGRETSLCEIDKAARFRIIRPHARGGLGQVSLALDQELHREVALKEIQPCHASDIENRQRFLVEAEITGRLEHPGVVPVYGLGRFSDGRPYYAMRFIRGESLKAALDDFHREDNPNRKDHRVRQLEFRQLLGRFIAVCNTIEYAHSRGILHRDLKPSNIMLGKYGETLVVDWGLAKCMDATDLFPDSEPSQQVSADKKTSSQTLPGSAVGTPAYMSPEQAAGRINEHGPASDIFGLGATLCHILCGEPPVRDSSTTIAINQARVGTIVNPGSGCAEIPQALEAVCLKAMAFRASDRYESAASLAADIERWLADEPVMAFRESAMIRLARWMRGHKTFVGTSAALLFASLIVGTIAIFLISAERNRTYLAGQRADLAALRADLSAQQAETSQRTAVEVANLLQQLFRSADPMGSEGFGMRDRTQRVADVTTRQLLDAAAREVSERLQNSPEIQASLFETMGNTYRGLSDYSTADHFLERSLQIRSEFFGEEHSAVASSLYFLGILRQDTGKYDEAEQLFRRSLDLQDRLIEPGQLLEASTKYQLARLLSEQPFAAVPNRERKLEAEALIRDALKIRQEKLGPNHHDVGVTMATLAGVRMTQGAEKEAQLLLASAFAILDRPENASDMGSAAYNWVLGENLRNQRKYKEAIEPLTKLVEIVRRQLGGEHPVYGIMLANLAGAQRQAGDLLSAENSIRQSLAIARKSAMRSQPSVLDWFLQYADGLLTKNAFDEAESLYREVVEYGQQGDSNANAPLVIRAQESLQRLKTVREAIKQPIP